MKDIEHCSKALVALARGRQADFGEDDLRVYLLGLDDMDDHALVDACLKLLRQPRRDGETAMPSVGIIRQEIGRTERRLAEQRESYGLLSQPNFVEQHPERWKNFRADVQKAILERHSFPSE